MKNLPLFKAIGLMSGTSMDAVDVAWIETDGFFYVRSLGSFSVAHENSLYQEMKFIEATMKDRVKDKSFFSLQSVKNAEQKIDLLHARAVWGLCQKYDIIADNVDVVGYHGQTVYHKPADRLSIQMGNPQYLANQLHMPVMGNVRQNDIQSGGQGAPVAPIYHQALAVRDALFPAAVINCGGISNITAIEGKEESALSGFDVGPGNGLLDRWVNEKTQGKEWMDRDGRYALAGKVNEGVLKDLYAESCVKNGLNYYEQKPPKSLDIRDFSWTSSFNHLSLEDGCATLAVFTAQCIVDGLKFISKNIKHVILVGGGWHHPLILKTLKNMINAQYGESVQVVCGDEINWSSQYLEAELMAYLAVRRLNNQPITFPMTTGVPSPVIGGDVFYPLNHVYREIK